MKILIDSNVLIGWADASSAARPVTSAALRRLREAGDEPVVSPQNLVEFWSVATRPRAANGLEQAPTRVDRLIEHALRICRLLDDTPAIHHEWRRLVAAYAVRGRQVHDARLAAVMRVHGIAHLLTFNGSDFRRYPGVVALDPRAVAGGP